MARILANRRSRFRSFGFSKPSTQPPWPHPFFAVTGDTGAFTINGIPPGTYTLGWQTQEVSVEPDKLTKIDFVLPKQ